MSETHEEFRFLKEELLKINTKRGGGVDGLKGYYAEVVNATEDNIRRIDLGIAARQIVIDNNGKADAIIRYSNGQSGRKIQYKNGYSFSKHKEFLSSGKYDGMIYAVNIDNPIFLNSSQIEELNKIAKEHNIKFVKATVSDSEMKILAAVASFEGNVRSKVGLDNKPYVTIEIYTNAKEAKYQIKKLMDKRVAFNDYVATQTSKFLNDNWAQINKSGMSQALSSAQFAAAFSVARNALYILKGDKDINEASKSVLKDTTSAAVLGYATGAIDQTMGLSNLGDLSVVVNGVVQISKEFISYINDNIDEEQLLENATKKIACLSAAYIGKVLGGSVGSIGGPIGTFVGQYVGEMITTAICSVIINTIYDTIHFEKNNKKYNSKMISLAHRAEYEIKESQNRLILLVKEENNRFIEELNKGYDEFMEGLEKCNYPVASSGLSIIGEAFGIEKEKLVQGTVSKGNIFIKKNRVIVMG